MSRKNPHPHVTWRNGRPRFNPGKDLRELGYKSLDLRHDDEDKSWFTRGEAVDWSLKLQNELAAKRLVIKRSKAKQPVVLVKKPAFYTIAQLWEDWRRSMKFRVGQPKAYSANTVLDYTQKIMLIEEDHPGIWNAPAARLDQPMLRRAYEMLWEQRGLASARGAMLVLSSAYSWGILNGRVRRVDNPAQGLRMETPDPRIRFATRKELAALIAAADAIGRPEIGDMIVLGVWTGQRQADRLSLLAVNKLNNRRIFRQAKTGAIVAIREAPELEARLTRAAERRTVAKAAALLAASQGERRAIEERFAHVVLDEAPDRRSGQEGQRRWLPFKKYHYPKVFAQVRLAAVEGVPDDAGGWKVEPCPSLEGFRDQDLRDTAVTYMALAESTVPEIISVTGHTAESATRILKHYLARHPEMADSAIGKMVAWYEGDGETEFGL